MSEENMSWLERAQAVNEDVLKVIEEYEKTLESGRPATRTRQMLKRRGPINMLERLMEKKEPQVGFEELVKFDQADKTFENVILKYPELFSEETLETAKSRLNSI